MKTILMLIAEIIKLEQNYEYSDESSEVTAIDSNIYEFIELAAAKEHSEISRLG